VIDGGPARLALTVRARVAWDGGEIAGYTVDVSVTGLFVETTSVLDVGTDVRVEFSVASGGGLTRVVAEGRVAVCLRGEHAGGVSPVSGLGIRFDTFLFGEQTLSRYVDRQVEAVLSMAHLVAQERRCSPRVTTGFPAFWGTRDPPDQEAFVADLSAEGCLLIGNDDAEPAGSMVHLWFELPVGGRSQPLRLAGRVVRVIPPGEERPAGLGIFFDLGQVDVETVDAVGRFVQQRLAWSALLEALPAGGAVGWPDLPGPEPGPEGATDAAPGLAAVELHPTGVRLAVIYRMLAGTLAVLLLVLVFLVIIVLRN